MTQPDDLGIAACNAALPPPASVRQERRRAFARQTVPECSSSTATPTIRGEGRGCQISGRNSALARLSQGHKRAKRTPRTLVHGVAL
ncbi:hypothetical protein VTJ49DRAFT_4768 [Mycothermus thermophilus]|uniref:Uncharacterized protein n=1 Tax=Humicola insolens TaxID=85995 RepID=A0ABR3VL22_HUMIN